MTATLIAFTPEPTHDEKARRRWHTYHAAYVTMQESARATGLPTSCVSPLSSMFNAGCKWAHFWERRAQKLSRQLTAALACDAITDDVRAGIVHMVTGSTRRDGKLLTASELEYLEGLRTLSDPDRAIMRRMLRALTLAAAQGAAPETGGGA